MEAMFDNFIAKVSKCFYPPFTLSNSDSDYDLTRWAATAVGKAQTLPLRRSMTTALKVHEGPLTVDAMLATRPQPVGLS